MAINCCLCIPPRAATIVIALFYIIIGTGNAVLYGLLGRASPGNSSIASYVYLGINILMAIVGLCGMIGAITKRRALVILFATLSWIDTVITIIGYVIVMIIIGVNYQNACLQANFGRQNIEGMVLDKEAQFLLGECKYGRGLTLGVVGGVGAVVILLMIHFSMVLSSYAKHLKRNKDTKLEYSNMN
ncbi:uncharacterized protein VTP21DRAFT_738 [Calcarisporiella thermophila]|uniref:uncharacterized protein n=1 Tax=Calcarisporiella thermophila TaxID=911321 RepID=UPI003742C59C